MWSNKARVAALAALIGALGACTDEAAGRLPHESAFGEAAGRNHAVQVNGTLPRDALLRLSTDFAAKAQDRVTFDFDSARLDAEAQAAVAGQAAWLAAHPGALVMIYGHADLVGPASYNEALGMRRARAVAARLTRLGVAPERIALVASLGEREPAAPVEARERRNRRALTVVEGYGAGWTGRAMDGKRAALAYERYVTDTVEEVQAEGTSDGAGGG